MLVTSWLVIALLAAACGAGNGVANAPTAVAPLTPASPTPTRTPISTPTVTSATPSPTPMADPTTILRQYYDAVNRGDVAAATALFASDAEAVFPWNPKYWPSTLFKGITQIQKCIEATVAGNKFTIISTTVSTTDESKATARLEIRNKVTAQMRFQGGERGILLATASFAGDKITRLNQEFDLSDPPTVRIADYQRLINEEWARGTELVPANTSLPFVPDWKEIAPPANGDVPNWQWVELNAPENYKLIAAVSRPSGSGPFPVIVFLHGGGGLTRGYLTAIEEKKFISSGFMTVVGMWFSGENPMNPPTEQAIRWPAAPPYTISYMARLKYVDALIQTARVLPGADSQRVGVFGLSQGGTAAVLVASPGKNIRAVVADSGQYARNFGRTDTPPVKAVKDLNAPLLLLHGTRDTIVSVEDAYDMDAALRQYGKTYDVRIYEGAAHSIDSQGNTPQVRADAVSRTIEFYKRYLAATQ